MNVQHQTVKKALATMYQKLGLKNRNEALLHYWGIWPVITREPHATLEQYLS